MTCHYASFPVDVLQNLGPLLGAYGIWAGRDLYSASTAVKVNVASSPESRKWPTDMSFRPSSSVVRFTWVFFTHMETSPLPVKGCRFWPILGTSWRLSSDCSLACHTYCNVAAASGGPVIHLFPSVLKWSCHCVYWRLRSAVAEIRTLNLPLARRTL